MLQSNQEFCKANKMLTNGNVIELLFYSSLPVLMKMY